MLKTSIAMAVVSFSVFGLSACDVEKTQEGNVTAPKYDMKTPDVAVTSEEKKIEAPTIEKEEKTVDVPKVEVAPANEK